MNIELSRNGLRAVLLYAAKNDIRYYLNGVLVQATKTATRLVGTNGHVLGMFHTSAENDVTDEPVEVIVPRSVIEAACRGTGSKHGLPLRLEGDGNKWEIVDFDKGVRFGFKPIEGKFPDAVRVVPTEASGVAAQFNPSYVALLGKTCSVFKLAPTKTTLYHNGTAGAVARIVGVHEFLAVLMPMRGEGEVTTGDPRPDWMAEIMVPVAKPEPEAVPA